MSFEKSLYTFNDYEINKNIYINFAVINKIAIFSYVL